MTMVFMDSGLNMIMVFMDSLRCDNGIHRFRQSMIMVSMDAGLKIILVSNGSHSDVIIDSGLGR